MPTPDWRLEWGQGRGVDVEVTGARVKADLIERQALATELANTIYRCDRTFDVVVYVADVKSKLDRESIDKTAASVGPGDVREEPGRWRVHTEPITRETHVIVSGPDPTKPDERPSWWPHPADKVWQARGVVAGPDAKGAPPQEASLTTST